MNATPKHPSPQTKREERVAAALRENLRKRKAQAVIKNDQNKDKS